MKRVSRCRWNLPSSPELSGKSRFLGCFFPQSRGRPHALACGPFSTCEFSAGPPCLVPSPSGLSLDSFPTFKSLCGWHRAPRITLGCVPVSRSLTSPPLPSLFATEGHVSQVPGVRTRTSLGAVRLPAVSITFKERPVLFVCVCLGLLLWNLQALHIYLMFPDCLPNNPEASVPRGRLAWVRPLH